ncbi:caspase recruitment domain-containing protein 9 isoform X2 [Peromyscus californicus insignis]|uniref:caspase recruitment domain-containing protein 9 isoform X2 n=1 Tax=Peromyscus californicus insignis TaxID=564181 RepID=UPI0022A72122|nr:caspase recruitment domain-containing protein 9 isoform X2 [Peromyscus californicus insignis]
MSDYENDDECWSALESFRVKLISVIDPSRITPYLRQCKVLNPDDEEQVLSDPNLVIRKRKVGVLLDILQRTGHKGYVAFLESLELYYPQLYRKVTGKEPARVFSMIIDASGESGLTQLLMTEVMKLQKKVQDLTALLSSKDDFIKELRVKDSLLRKHQERVQRLKEECELSSRELKRCKDENYDLAMRLAHLSEEKGSALMRNRDLQLEVDRLRHSLMKAEDDCKVERKHTLKLRHAMEQRPSQELLWELQQEKDLLQARVQELEVSVQEGKLDRNSPYIQVLEEDWRQALKEHQEQANTIFSLRKDLRQAEALRTRAMASREELHAQCAQSFQDKDELRKQVRELGEKADELQLQLFQSEGRLLAAEGRLKQQQLDMLILSSDLEDSSPRNSQELSLPQDLEEDAQLSDRGEEVGVPCTAEPALAQLSDRGEEVGVPCTAEPALAQLSDRGEEVGVPCTAEPALAQLSDRGEEVGVPCTAEPALAQLSDRGVLADRESPEQPCMAQNKEQLSQTHGTGPSSSSEPPEKERRRLKESFENYRRKRALRKVQNSWRPDEGDRENTTGSDNTDTEGA